MNVKGAWCVWCYSTGIYKEVAPPSSKVRKREEEKNSIKGGAKEEKGAE